MLNKNHLVTIVLALFLITPALADQAAFLSKSNADRVIQLLKNTATVKSYCLPCGDLVADTLTINDITEVDADDAGNWEIQINGQGVDLAYLYYPENNKWRNVAIALNIPVQDVPEFID